MTSPSRFFEVQVPSGLDIVSDVQFSPQNQMMVSSWDNRVILYDCSKIAGEKVDTLGTLTSPSTPLSLVYSGTNGAFVGCLDGSIRQVDYENSKLQEVYSSEHNGANGPSPIGDGINRMCRVYQDENVIVASSFNGVFRVIDLRSRQQVSLTKVGHNSPKPHKIFTMDSSQGHLSVGLSSNQIELYDIRNLAVPFEQRELGLKYQIKDLKCVPDHTGFAVSTVDGRVSLECFDSSPEVQASNRFTFKCHRSQDKANNTDLVYSVNSLAFAQNGTLFTAGADGAVCLWDCDKKKRIKMYPKFSEGIAKIALSNDDKILAVATSDDNFIRARRLSDPVNRSVPSKLYVRELAEGEAGPR